MPELDAQPEWFKQSADFRLHPIEAQKSQDMITPTISVDRALGHLVEGLRLDSTLVQDFYYGLPHPDKIDLDDLRIHISASLPILDTADTQTAGVFMRHGTARIDKKLSPELEKTIGPTIVIYLGAFLMDLENDDSYKFSDKETSSLFINSQASEYLAHELTHLAQKNREDITPENKLKRLIRSIGISALSIVLGIKKKKKDVAVGLGTATIAELSTGGGAGSVAVGVGSALLSHLANRKDRAASRAVGEYDNYLERENEIDARKHQKGAPEFFSIEMLDKVQLPFGHGTKSFVKTEDDKLSLALSRAKHKELSLTPRGGNPKQIRKDSMSSERRAIKSKFKADIARIQPRIRRKR